MVSFDLLDLFVLESLKSREIRLIFIVSMAILYFLKIIQLIDNRFGIF